MITVSSYQNDTVYTAKELLTIRWQFSFLFNTCGAQRTTADSLCNRERGWGTKHYHIGRCKWHGGNSTGSKTEEGKLATTRGRVKKLIKGGKYSKMSKDIWNDKEKSAYSTILSILLNEYEVDEIGADQIAVAIVYQKYFLIPKLQSGDDVDLNPTSDNIRKWLNEYMITPKSKSAETNVQINLAGIVMEVYQNGNKGAIDADCEVVAEQPD